MKENFVVRAIREHEQDKPLYLSEDAHSGCEYWNPTLSWAKQMTEEKALQWLEAIKNEKNIKMSDGNVRPGMLNYNGAGLNSLQMKSTVVFDVAEIELKSVKGIKRTFELQSSVKEAISDEW